MNNFDSSHIPADLLDHLVLDICELERLKERVDTSLKSAELEAIPKGPLAVHLMDLLFRMEEASGVLHGIARNRIKRVVFALSSDPAWDCQPDRQCGDRSLAVAVEGQGAATWLRRQQPGR